jgi:hypothetical protein
MLNFKAKKEALEALEMAHNSYEFVGGRVKAKAEELFNLRQSSSVELIPAVESYINTLANSPKEYEKTFSEYKAEFTVFKNILVELEVLAREAAVKAGGGTVLGVAAGVSTAAFAPTAAMAIATSFGTASTGTAISTLGGAAASNAALAWLGGGALTAGGGGMAAGQALLALAGPIGWAIGGAALVGGGIYARGKNTKILAEAIEHRKVLDVNTAELSTGLKELERTYELTYKHVEGVKTLLKRCEMAAPHDYVEFEDKHKEWVGSLVNHVRSLSVLLNKKVDIQ